MYADDIAVTTQSTDFAPIEETLTSALDGLSEYYTTNQLRANPTKTQVSLFHLRNGECGKQLNISWNGVNLTHSNLPLYNWTESCHIKHIIEKTENKVGTRNNIIRKLRTSKWGATPTTPRSSALALYATQLQSMFARCGNGHSKLRTRGTNSMDISEWCHA